ncbi:hypothetical protein BIV57_20300 [Mangrovactinospora gilvigrisea]|uniref:Pilus assembly protein TadE n=1 Tax=Mangrovactinospora gilvigrisea TaxID=1428644 RepID=A0A1J7BQE8_9ACTN|nr:TadE family type IV pilus minor pilin [Mangrovactinospora gilvigrisea]OIV35673.1 hypothetical protein BIV57_20300 [Mangrovactinospora gilvigrisea]
MPGSERAAGGDAGFVTAEAAAVLPALVLLAAVLMWGIAVATAQLRCVDAAREGARSAARGDPPSVVATAVRAAGPRGAALRVRRGDDGLVRVRVTGRAPAFAGLGRVLTMPVAAEEAALDERIGGGGEGAVGGAG